MMFFNHSKYKRSATHRSLRPPRRRRRRYEIIRLWLLLLLLRLFYYNTHASNACMSYKLLPM